LLRAVIYIASEEPFELFARPRHVLSCIAGVATFKKLPIKQMTQKLPQKLPLIPFLFQL
jgi:hypothetical protein